MSTADSNQVKQALDAQERRQRLLNRLYRHKHVPTVEEWVRMMRVPAQVDEHSIRSDPRLRAAFRRDEEEE